jgi:hypothetical protein
MSCSRTQEKQNVIRPIFKLSQRFLAISGVFWPYSGEIYRRIKKFAQNSPQNGHKLDQRSPENMTHFRQKFAEHSSLFRRKNVPNSPIMIAEIIRRRTGDVSCRNRQQNINIRLDPSATCLEMRRTVLKTETF